MKAYTLSIAILVSLNEFSQQDYVITAHQDTLRGEVYLGLRPFNTTITVYQAAGGEKFIESAVKEYKKNRKYMVVPKRERKNGGYWYQHCKVIEDSPMRLLYRTEIDDVIHYVYHEGEFTYVRSQTFAVERDGQVL